MPENLESDPYELRSRASQIEAAATDHPSTQNRTEREADELARRAGAERPAPAHSLRQRISAS